MKRTSVITLSKWKWPIPNGGQITNAGRDILRLGTIFLYELQNIPQLLLRSEKTLKSDSVSIGLENLPRVRIRRRLLPSSAVNHA